MIVIVALVGRTVVLTMIVVAGHIMSLSIVTIEVIADGMITPVGMNPFPGMEAHRAVGIQGQPDVAGSKIVILVANNADVFDAVPDVVVWNRLNRDGGSWNCYHGYGHLHLHHRSGNTHRDYRPGQQWQSRET